MREKIREYINQLDEEIKRAESEIVNTDDKDYEARMMSRLNTLTEVRNDLHIDTISLMVPASLY